MPILRLLWKLSPTLAQAAFITCPLVPWPRQVGASQLGLLCLYPQIVSQTKVTKPLLLKNGKTAGKSTITVGKVTCTYPWAGHSMPLYGHP